MRNPRRSKPTPIARYPRTDQRQAVARARCRTKCPATRHAISPPSRTQESTLDENREEQVAVAGHEQTTHKKASLIPTTVTATVLVPKSYFRQALGAAASHRRRRQSPRCLTRRELKTIEQAVTDTISKTVDRTLPPLEPGETAASRVEVSSYDDLPPPLIEPPTLGRHRTSLVRRELAEPRPDRRRPAELADAAQHGSLERFVDPRIPRHGQRRRQRAREEPVEAAPEPESIMSEPPHVIDWRVTARRTDRDGPRRPRCRRQCAS